MTWTKDQEVILVAQVRAGKSMREMANNSYTIFGHMFSRNAIAGRIWRMRRDTGDDTLRPGLRAGRAGRRPLTPEERAARREMPPSPQRGGWYYAKRRALARQLGEGESPDAEMLRALEVLKEPKVKRKPAGLPEGVNEQGIVCCEAVTIHNLNVGKCHWPLWQASDPYDFDEIKYCGNTCTGVYCAAHKHIGYWIGRRRRTPEQRAMAVRLHHRFSENGGQNIGRAA